MAEIRIDERRRGPGWIWGLIALVLVVLLIWYFNSTARRAEDTMRGDTIGSLSPFTPDDRDAERRHAPPA